MSAAAGARPARPPEVAAGIHRLEVSIPFPSATANCYLIEDEPLTLVDVGPNLPRALEELEAQFAALGHELESLELILLTHTHIDHAGLIGPLAERTGAEVAALDVMVPFVEDFWGRADRQDRFGGDAMLHYGVPSHLVDGIREALRKEIQAASVARVGRPLRDGAVVGLAGRKLEVHHRPGHSAVDTVFHDVDGGVLIAGDHLLDQVSSSPSLWPPLDGPADLSRRPRPLIEYTHSLRATRETEVGTTLPGHGEPIADHRKLVDRRVGTQERRAERLEELVAEEPGTAYDLAHRVWGRFADKYPFPALCEIVTHMDLLVEAGAVHEAEGPDGATRYEPR